MKSDRGRMSSPQFVKIMSLSKRTVAAYQKLGRPESVGNSILSVVDTRCAARR